ncbi:MAG: hypothetical protein FWD54_02740 [Endomicrobia bacterium]|nr:hypothetical protein [Endomicrobiia bacterium]MCL2799181.1 hypothetical protein [Endomicrobiia bacterium]
MISCSVFDYPARIAGFSTQKFENEKSGRFEETFNMSKKDGFNKTLEIISKLKARATHKSFRKGFIVAFDFSKSFDYCLDSTEAAVFFDEIDANTVKVSVVCNNSLLAKNLSEKVFAKLRD